MWYPNIRSALFSFLTIHASDRRTDRQTELRQQYRALHYNWLLKVRNNENGKVVEFNRDRKINHYLDGTRRDAVDRYASACCDLDL